MGSRNDAVANALFQDNNNHTKNGCTDICLYRTFYLLNCKNFSLQLCIETGFEMLKGNSEATKRTTVNKNIVAPF